MEVLTLGGLILYGLSQNNNPNKTIKKTDTNKKKVRFLKDIIEKEHQQLDAKTYPIVKNDVMGSLPNSSKISSNNSSKSTFEGLFDVMKIKNNGVVKSFNEAPQDGKIENPIFKREIDYLEGFSDFNNTNMDYGVSNDLTHNNMIPNTSQRDMPLMNYENRNTKLNLFTGSSVDWTPKKEVENMFKPMKKYRNKPIIGGDSSFRYIPSYKNNMGNLPFKHNVKVAPGIDGKNQTGVHSTYRIMPRNIDEIRSENNQKLVYKKPLIESGKKGRLPAKVGKYQSEKSGLDNRKSQQSSAAYKKTRVISDATHKITPNKSYKSNYQGPVIRKSGNVVKGKYESTGRNIYSNNGIVRHAVDKTQGINVNHDSFQQYENNRDTTKRVLPGQAIQSQSTYANLTDEARDTIKQTTLYSHEGHVNPDSHKTYSNLTDEARDTIKQTTLYSHEGHINPDSHKTYSNLTDEARDTIKQTTLYSHEGNINPDSHKTYSNLTDEARDTIKQTTLYSHEGNINPDSHKTYSNLTDEARDTIKQTTLYSHEGNINPDSHKTYSNLTDEARDTIKQTTLYSHEGNVNPDSHKTYSNLTDEARKTIKQTTLYSHEGNTSNPTNHTTYSNLTDKARQTIKETTLSSEDFRIHGKEQNYVLNKTFKAKPTVKQTTLYSTPEINLKNPQGRDRQIIMDKARPTIKQTTHLIGYTGVAGSVDKKARVFDDALNMQHDSGREDTLVSRPNPGGDQKYRKYYKDDSDSRQKMFINSARRPNESRAPNYKSPNINKFNFTRDSNTTIINNYHINDDFINTLKNNPLVNDLQHQKNINY